MSPDTSIASSPPNTGPAKLGTGPVLGRVAASAGAEAGLHVGKQQNVNRVHDGIRIGDSVARVDRAHAADKHSFEGKPSDSPSAAGNDLSAAGNETTATHELNAREAWLNFHASDLIMRLQEWATDLDAREASLNAAYARQDLRERQFRLCRQQVEIQIAEHLAAAKALRTEMQSHARRIAFELG